MLLLLRVITTVLFGSVGSSRLSLDLFLNWGIKRVILRREAAVLGFILGLVEHPVGSELLLRASVIGLSLLAVVVVSVSVVVVVGASLIVAVVVVVLVVVVIAELPSSWSLVIILVVLIASILITSILITSSI